MAVPECLSGGLVRIEKFMAFDATEEPGGGKRLVGARLWAGVSGPKEGDGVDPNQRLLDRTGRDNCEDRLEAERATSARGFRHDSAHPGFGR